VKISTSTRPILVRFVLNQSTKRACFTIILICDRVEIAVTVNDTVASPCPRQLLPSEADTAVAKRSARGNSGDMRRRMQR
jgi:hypothetical protein